MESTATMAAKILLLALLFGLFLQSECARREKKARSPKWWALAKVGEPNNAMPDSHHQRLSNSFRKYNYHIVRRSQLKSQSLTRKQRKLIRKNPGSLNPIVNGAKMAVDECQHQFRNRRWNCPTTHYMNGKSIFGKIGRSACRETAFLYAMTSAAVSHTVSRACSEGQLQSCTCDYESRRGRRNRMGSLQENGDGDLSVDWQWGGCSDNIRFGYKFARYFVDAAERGRDQRFIMNLHNNEVGRIFVKSMMRRECKCHGMSGSCTVKTCWMRLSLFREVGNALKSQFDGASRVMISNDAQPDSNTPSRRHLARPSEESLSTLDIQLQPFNPDHKPPKSKDLVYLFQSPDFCTKNRRLGVRGTVGRRCNSTSLGVDGCDLMCCGRGYKTEVRQEMKRCSCTFHWCCQVKCKVCKTSRTINTCL